MFECDVFEPRDLIGYKYRYYEPLSEENPLLVLPQITDLNRRMSAIETFLNHLELNVTSTYHEVSPLI